MLKKVMDHEASRYVLSGATTFLLENISFLVIFYSVSRKVVFANVASVVISGIYNFALSKFYVFRMTKHVGRTFHQLALYVAIVIINTLVSTLAIAWLLNNRLGAYLAKPAVTLLIAAWTFYIYKFIIFKDSKNRIPDND